MSLENSLFVAWSGAMVGSLARASLMEPVAVHQLKTVPLNCLPVVGIFPKEIIDIGSMIFVNDDFEKRSVQGRKQKDLVTVQLSKEGSGKSQAFVLPSKCPA
jgi:hypothetical protein